MSTILSTAKTPLSSWNIVKDYLTKHHQATAKELYETVKRVKPTHSTTKFYTKLAKWSRQNLLTRPKWGHYALAARQEMPTKKAEGVVSEPPAMGGDHAVEARDQSNHVAPRPVGEVADVIHERLKEIGAHRDFAVREMHRVALENQHSKDVIKTLDAKLTQLAVELDDANNTANYWREVANKQQELAHLKTPPRCRPDLANEETWRNSPEAQDLGMSTKHDGTIIEVPITLKIAVVRVDVEVGR